MKQEEIDIAIRELEERLDRLRALYEQYFMGYEKLEPSVQRKDVDRRFAVLMKEQIRNTAQRFKFNVLRQKYNTYSMYWQRICRQIEDGTYKRHVHRAKQRFGDVEPVVSTADVQAREPLAPEDVMVELVLDDDEFEGLDGEGLLEEVELAMSAMTTAPEARPKVAPPAPPSSTTSYSMGPAAESRPRLRKKDDVPESSPALSVPPGATASPPKIVRLTQGAPAARPVGAPSMGPRIAPAPGPSSSRLAPPSVGSPPATAGGPAPPPPAPRAPGPVSGPLTGTIPASPLSTRAIPPAAPSARGRINAPPAPGSEPRMPAATPAAPVSSPTAGAPSTRGILPAPASARGMTPATPSSVRGIIPAEPSSARGIVPAAPSSARGLIPGDPPEGRAPQRPAPSAPSIGVPASVRGVTAPPSAPSIIVGPKPPPSGSRIPMAGSEPKPSGQPPRIVRVSGAPTPATPMTPNSVGPGPRIVRLPPTPAREAPPPKERPDEE